MACPDDKSGMPTIKITSFIVLLMTTHTLHAEVFTHQYERSKSEKIEIVTVDNMKVSESCSKNKKSCFALFDRKKVSVHKKTKLRGNPASIYCHEKGGFSSIFKDEKNNEYDFCRFEKDFYVDSWDLYKRYAK